VELSGRKRVYRRWMKEEKKKQYLKVKGNEKENMRKKEKLERLGQGE